MRDYLSGSAQSPQVAAISTNTSNCDDLNYQEITSAMCGK